MNGELMTETQSRPQDPLNGPQTCHVKLTHPQATVPKKAHDSDVGYDLSIVEPVKQIGASTWLYNTGVQCHPDAGWYLEVSPRSSLSKSGYVMTNSVGIIDPSYRGDLMVALTKIDDTKPDIVFPFRCCQIIVRKHFGMTFEQVDTLGDTERGQGGFGSTGV
jgi:dUTP pyrophosphatase